jgi:hypothetical protein
MGKGFLTVEAIWFLARVASRFHHVVFAVCLGVSSVVCQRIEKMYIRGRGRLER